MATGLAGFGLVWQNATYQISEGDPRKTEVGFFSVFRHLAMATLVATTRESYLFLAYLMHVKKSRVIPHGYKSHFGRKQTEIVAHSLHYPSPFGTLSEN